MVKSRKVLIFTPGLGKGGAESQLIRVAKFLQDSTYEVKIISLNSNNDFDIKDLNVALLGNWKRRPIRNVFSICKMIFEFKPDVVIAFMFSAIIVARIFKLFFGYYLISSVRNSEIGRKWKRLFRLTKSIDDVVTFNAPHSRSNLEMNGIVKKGGIVVPNIVPSDHVELTRFDSGEIFTWICIAHFRASKDYQTLFKAISLLKSRPFKVNIIGNIRDQKWPFDMVKELGIEDHVNLLGFVSNPAPFIHASDAFVLSSKWEGSPNALLESMLHGKIVVGSNIGGIREVVEESKCGYLFPQGREIELSNMMIKVMESSQEERLLKGNRGRQYILDNFAEDVVLNHWEKIVLRGFATTS